jgi:hypothetical protein
MQNLKIEDLKKGETFSKLRFGEPTNEVLKFIRESSNKYYSESVSGGIRVMSKGVLVALVPCEFFTPNLV